ncbi:MAG: threonine ammonia-lyase [Pseudobdellovibrionaceae bacterium]|nr:MAG: threonine ammonia-lyase [Pseudobdellovibrionaceae bacterium]
MKITLDKIQEAQKRIANIANRTPLEFSSGVSQRLGAEVYLKYENKQPTGSFKIRGALNKILQLTEKERAQGIIAASAGNHAQGVAFSARHVGATSHIVMPEGSPIVKIQATQNYGANVILAGNYFDESYAYAQELAKENGYIFVPAFSDPNIIAGQGTLGLEVVEDLKDLDSVIVPIGGGGLISGVATAIKSLLPKCKVYGVVAENAPGMKLLYRGEPYDRKMARPSIADGIAVKNPSQELFDHYIKHMVDDIVSVNEAEIAEAITFLLERTKTMVEGSGAVGLAAASKAGWDLGKKSCLILSGGNIDLNLLAQVIEKGLSKSGRIARIEVIVSDRPGTLNELTDIIAEQEANVLEVRHDRLSPHVEIRQTAIDFLLETKDDQHVASIVAALKTVGAIVR